MPRETLIIIRPVSWGLFLSFLSGVIRKSLIFKILSMAHKVQKKKKERSCEL